MKTLPALFGCLTALITNASAQSLPLGDGKVSTAPMRGNVFACQTTFRGGGARHDGPWIHGETWNPLEKPHVAGRITWPNAVFGMSVKETMLSIAGNGLPVQQPTGIFPIARTDSVYQYDTNPNAIAAINLSFEIPLTPLNATKPECLPMGMIGFTLTGVALYNALDDAGRDAAAHEVQDLCDGHPQGKGQYHYHSTSPCLPGADADSLVGWALDGYPIFGARQANGVWLTNADLDACHGRAESRTISGRKYSYAYRLKNENPYTMGCYTGVVLASTRQSIRQAMGPPR